MSAANYPITGPPPPSVAPADGKKLCEIHSRHTLTTSGSVPLRLEVRDLQQRFPDQWNLYLLGLEAFYKLDETSDLSFYGIAGNASLSLYSLKTLLIYSGIHGRPYREWGNVTGPNDSRWQGYCTHTSILFAPWHRPYVSLFEVYSSLQAPDRPLLSNLQQVLYGIIQQLASSFPDSTKARYQQAAATFRIPYWDWAAQPPSGDQYFPVSVGGSVTASVITPQSNGQTVQIPNPLYSYKFAPLNPESGDFVSDQGIPVCTSDFTIIYVCSTRNSITNGHLHYGIPAQQDRLTPHPKRTRFSMPCLLNSLASKAPSIS
jgi:tyrosinase